MPTDWQCSILNRTVARHPPDFADSKFPSGLVTILDARRGLALGVDGRVDMELPSTLVWCILTMAGEEYVTLILIHSSREELFSFHA